MHVTIVWPINHSESQVWNKVINMESPSENRTHCGLLIDPAKHYTTRGWIIIFLFISVGYQWKGMMNALFGIGPKLTLWYWISQFVLTGEWYAKK